MRYSCIYIICIIDTAVRRLAVPHHWLSLTILLALTWVGGHIYIYIYIYIYHLPIEVSLGNKYNDFSPLPRMYSCPAKNIPTLKYGSVIIATHVQLPC